MAKAKRGKWGRRWDEAKIYVVGTLFIISPMLMMWAWNTATEPLQPCEQYATVTSVKSASAGGFLSSDVCVYETDKGDITKEDCRYDAGDKIFLGWKC